MNENLAKQLLKTDAMKWTDLEWTEERKFIENFSNYKYDEYQQYAPGRRFIEHLYLWLKQFGTIAERKIAYQYIKNNLIFISNSELDHLIKMSYRDLILGYLIKKLQSVESDIDANKVVRTIKNEKFSILKEQCLFLGLSDGAKIDVFRRHSSLDHEQVFSTYLISDTKTNEFLKKLNERLIKYKVKEEKKFKIVFLVDDFSASGLSFIRKKDGKYRGKIPKFFTPIKEKMYTSTCLRKNLPFVYYCMLQPQKLKNILKKWVMNFLLIQMLI